MVRPLAASHETVTGESLVSRAMHAVNAHIRDEHLRPGQAIPSESAFALRIGVSRAVVREAFRSLAAVGVIEIGNGRRARVGGIDDTVLPIILDHAVLTEQVSVQQIYDVRRAIELRTVALAALRRTPAEAEALLALTARMEQDFDSPEKVKESDIAFHEVIARASRNPLFSAIVSAFRVITEKTWHIGWSSRPADRDRRANVLCHQRIAEAIARQNAREAEALMGEHFDNSVKALLAAGIT
ncbi:MAG: FadR/GntR family transcriptional regulator [Aestuariivirga sp.]|uniref:FadR/GntR family transcriptional regulator n=1 Tax=Aestuariivirga sp. TaxID=2650926 RepID=UPI0038D19A1F